jgi:hypothetical protein
VRKAITLITASLLLIAGLVLYVITSSPTETVTLHFVDAVTGTPVNDVNTLKITFKGLFTARIDKVLFNLHLVTPPRPTDSQSTSSNGTTLLTIEKGHQYETILLCTSPAHLEVTIGYHNGLWRGTNSDPLPTLLPSDTWPIYPVTNGVLTIPLHRRQRNWL